MYLSRNLVFGSPRRPSLNLPRSRPSPLSRQRTTAFATRKQHCPQNLSQNHLCWAQLRASARQRPLHPTRPLDPRYPPPWKIISQTDPQTRCPPVPCPAPRLSNPRSAFRSATSVEAFEKPSLRPVFWGVGHHTSYCPRTVPSNQCTHHLCRKVRAAGHCEVIRVVPRRRALYGRIGIGVGRPRRRRL